MPETTSRLTTLCLQIQDFCRTDPIYLILQITASKKSTADSRQDVRKQSKCAIVGGENYGQGSSREHAALAPLYLGVKFVMAKSFARIHRSNLINSGIMPLVFEDPADYDDFSIGDTLVIENAPEQVKSGSVEVKNTTTGKTYKTKTNFSELEIALILKGGKINYMKG